VSRSFGCLTALALAACAAKAGSVSTSTFSPEQRAQIVAVMRDAMKKDPTILREAIVELQADNDRLEARVRHETLSNRQDVLYDAGDPSIGNPHAKTTIVEFFDPRCPYCKQLAPALTHFVATHDVRLVYKVFPILGPSSELAARALLAAARQGGYERLRAAIMQGESEDDLTLATIRAAAMKTGLDWQRLSRDMNDPAIAKQLETDNNLAADLGIDSTPTIVIGQKIVEGPDLPMIAADVADANHDRSNDRSKRVTPMSTAER